MSPRSARDQAALRIVPSYLKPAARATLLALMVMTTRRDEIAPT
jgi:hypothetical protein